MIAVSSSNQKIGVILDFMRHLLAGFVRGQTDLYTVYIKDMRKARCLPVPDQQAVSRWGKIDETDVPGKRTERRVQ
jgi:hypothetical protein